MPRAALFISLLLLLGCTAVSPANQPLPTLVALATLPPEGTGTPVPLSTPTAMVTAPTAAAAPAGDSSPPTVTTTPTPCPFPGEIVQSALTSVIAGSLNFRIYLPPCYEDGRQYPTLYMLSGNIHNDVFWDDLGLDEAAAEGAAAGLWPPFLIVMADGGWIANNSSGGPGSYERVIVDELIPLIEREYCAWPDPAGRAIGGVSRGGYWALEIAFQHPQLFASVGGHSAALLDVAAGPEINPQQTGLTRDLGDLRIYLDFGTDDYLIGNTQRLHEQMEAADPPVPHTWALNEGGHDEAYWSAQIDTYLAWYSAPWPMNRDAYPVCP